MAVLPRVARRRELMMTWGTRWLSGALFLTLVLAGCSDDSGEATPTTTTVSTSTVVEATTTTTTTTTTTAAPAPDPVRSAIDFSGLAVEPIGDAGAGVAQAAATPDDGYRETEYFVSGTAALYVGPSVGPVEVASTGTPYVTRILVRRPIDPAAFSGRAVIEPFNTSGSDAAAARGMIGPVIAEQGDVWVGVSARWLSMNTLQQFDADRYGSISIPSNGLAWDILAQLGGLLKEGGDESPLQDLQIDRLYMAGYSQNGIDTATFASTFGELSRMTDGTPIYDGYLPLAHAGSMTPIDSGPSALPAFEIVPIGSSDVPVIDVESEADVLGFSHPDYTSDGHASVRRDDSDEVDDLYRLWEIPGGAHVKGPIGCDSDGTSFPLEFFVRAAYQRLILWAEDGVAAPSASRITMTAIDVVSVAERDDVGNALGGVRSPFVDVPIASYQGGDTGSVICGLGGVETPLDANTLGERYDDLDDYLAQFGAALTATIDAGFLRSEDQSAILDYATEQASAAFG
ncbi:MAG: alpha/beta hydrolase domain-containing protein [Acidimicrobiales bacterium]|nr:alpha/beta hydrolase domain-containing protein [Acidimicrobiales bacterium]